MEQHPTAGARVRMTIEGTVRDAYQPGIFTLGDGTHVSYTHGQHRVEILTPGWEVGDMIDTEHGVLTRVVNDGYAHWQCTEFEPPRAFHDDQVRPDDVRVILRKSPAPEQVPGPVVDYAARWHAVEALVSRALSKGVTRLDTDQIARALGLDEDGQPAGPGTPYVSRVLPPRDEVCARPGCSHVGEDHHHGDTKCWAHLARTRDASGVLPPVKVCECPGFVSASAEPGDEADGVSPHNFKAKWMSEAAAKRGLPKCSVCDGPATAAAHDGDQSPETLHLRALLTH